jgi:pyruvate-formate lyase-activating enzyme
VVAILRSKAADLSAHVGEVQLALSTGPEASVGALLGAVRSSGLGPGSRVTVQPTQGRALSPRGTQKLAQGLAQMGYGFVLTRQIVEPEASDVTTRARFDDSNEVRLRPANVAGAQRVDGVVRVATGLLSDGKDVMVELAGAAEDMVIVEHWIAQLVAHPALRLRIVPDPSEELEVSAEVARTLLAALPEGRAWAVGFPLCLVPEALPAERHASVGWSAWQAVAAVRRLKPAACAGCDHHVVCSGVAAETIHRDGGAALRPVSVQRLPNAAASLRGVPIATQVMDGRPAETERLDISPRYPDTSLVTLIVPGCDLNCVFCEGEPDGMSLSPSSLEGVRAALIATAGTSTGVFFTGGEPTQLPWLLDALRSANELGYTRVQMQSHAGRAAESDYAEALVDAGLTAIDVPLYGATAKVHEEITSTPGSFDATVQGVERLRALGVRIVLHVTLFKSNLPSLSELLGFMAGLEPDGVYLQVTGEVGKPGTYERVAPSPASVGAAVAKALDTVKPTFPVRVADVPLCLLPEHEAHVSRWRDTPELGARAIVLPFTEWLSTFSAGKTRDYGARCEGCDARSRCDGLSHEALVRFGDHELRPR